MSRLAVQVLGAVVILGELAGPEGDHVPGQVPDRPDQAPAEHVHRPAPALPGQPAAEQLGVGEAAAAQVPGQRVPVGRGVPDSEPRPASLLESSRGQESARGGGFASDDPFCIEIRGRAVRVDQPPALGVLLARDVPALLVPQLDAGPGREPFHRLGEAQVVDPLHEPDDVAALGAGEAVPQPAGRGDVEGRRLLLVERAQPLERAAPGAAELQVLPHNLIDRGALADQRDVLVADSACHVRPPPLALPLGLPAIPLGLPRV